MSDSSVEELPVNLRGFFELAEVDLEQVSVSLIDANGAAVERPLSCQTV